MQLLIRAAIHARKYTDNKRMYKKTKPQEFGTPAHRFQKSQVDILIQLKIKISEAELKFRNEASRQNISIFDFDKNIFFHKC